MSKGKQKGKDSQSSEKAEGITQISKPEELKALLMNIRDKMSEGVGAPIFAVSAMNYALCRPNIYTLLNDENKELARDVWLRIKSAGLHVKSPPMLFGADEEQSAG